LVDQEDGVGSGLDGCGDLGETWTAVLSTCHPGDRQDRGR
jgi:hypothetical protein